MREITVKLVASFLFIGYAPVAPGTWGSIAGLLIAYFIPSHLPLWTLLLSLLGLAICGPSRKAFKTDDPSAFVLDEVCGMMLSVVWLPKELIVYAAAFLLFRIGDIWKPWPVSLIQKHPHATSIMGDDLAVGLVVNLILQAILYLRF